MKDFWFWRSLGRSSLMVTRLHGKTTWQVDLLGLQVEYWRRELFITNWGPLLERSFMLWLRWPLWGRSPKGIVLWRARGSRA